MAYSHSRARRLPFWRRAIGNVRRRIDAVLLPYQQPGDRGDWRDRLAALLDDRRVRATAGLGGIFGTCSAWIEGRDGSGAAPASIMALRRHFLAGLVFCA